LIVKEKASSPNKKINPHIKQIARTPPQPKWRSCCKRQYTMVCTYDLLRL